MWFEQNVLIDNPLASTYSSPKSNCNEMQSKVHHIHTSSSMLSPCNNSLQATGVWHCDGMTQQLTLLKSTEIPKVQNNQKTNQNEHNCVNALQPGTARFQFWEMDARPEWAFCMTTFLSSSPHSKYPENADKHRKTFMVTQIY